MAEHKRRVLLVDDHALFRGGLKMLINDSDDFVVVGEASNGREFLNMVGELAPDVVLLDISMPEMDGIEAAAISAERFPKMPIITLSMYGEEDYYFKMVSLGVKGFLLKNSDISEVLSAMESVIGGGTFFAQELLHNLVSNLRSTGALVTTSLSERELEILLLICKGYSNQEIAVELFISKRTVDKHRANILFKTNCKNTANLVVYAIKNHLVEI